MLLSMCPVGRDDCAAGEIGQVYPNSLFNRACPDIADRYRLYRNLGDKRLLFSVKFLHSRLNSYLCNERTTTGT